MYIIKILIWLSIYFIFYILFSLNTLISIFCFIIIVILTSILLLQLHVEYLTFLILLLYLGGILIFFLFTTLMLNNEDMIKNYKSSYSFENTLILILFFKIFYWISIFNSEILFFKNINPKYYLNSYITENFSKNTLYSFQNDVINLINLYSDKYILLITLGMILLFTMVGVIVITKNRHA